jgi:hypothetical protein
MTYPEIQHKAARILGVRPSSVKTCWIAEAKRVRGLTRGLAPNTGQGRGAPVSTKVQGSDQARPVRQIGLTCTKPGQRSEACADRSRKQATSLCLARTLKQDSPSGSPIS